MSDELSIFGVGDTVFVQNWKKGEKLILKCNRCEELVHIDLEEENVESVMYSKDLKCSCGHSLQLIY